MLPNTNCIGKTTRSLRDCDDSCMKRWLQFVMLSLAASVFAHAPKPKLVLPRALLEDSAGLTINYEYNNQGLPTRAYTANGNLFQVTYDVYDRPVTTIDANGVQVTTTYDNLGRPRFRTFPTGTEEFIYNSNGLARYRDPERRETGFGYDGAGRLRSITNAELRTLWLEYDASDNVVRLTDYGSNTTAWAYDFYSRPIRETNAVGALNWTNSYDVLGRVVGHWTPEKGLTTFSYDANGNVRTAAYTGFTISYAYDALNRLRQVADALGTSTFTYTNYGAFVGALWSEDGPWAADTVAVTHAERLPRGLSITQPIGAVTNSFGYDSQLRLQTITTPQGAFTYHYANAGNLVRQINLPGGSVRTNYFNTAGELREIRLKNPSGVVLDQQAYGYDASGLRTNLTRLSGATLDYLYDAWGSSPMLRRSSLGGRPRA
jgi:YD repeat-containing protein